MKILHVIPSLRKGGAERLALDICRELQKREGIEVKLLVLHDENEYQYLSGELNVIKCDSYYRFHILRSNEADFSQYRNIVESFKPDVIHSHLFEAEFFTRSCLFPSAVYFSHLHDNMPQFENFSASILLNKERLTRWLEKRRLIKNYLECGNSFIANSEDTESYFKERLPAELRKRVTLLHNAIDLSHFPFVSRSLSSEEIRLVSTGSLVEKKNHLFLLYAVKQLKKSGKKINLEILGDGPLKNELEKRIDELDIRSEVNLQGNVDDVAHYLREAHVYVHTATYEPFGLAIVEGMATGLPVVCLDGRGNRMLIRNGENGFMLTQADPIAFANKILDIVRDESTYRKFSDEAHKSAQQSDIRTYINQLVRLYQNAVTNTLKYRLPIR